MSGWDSIFGNKEERAERDRRLLAKPYVRQHLIEEHEEDLRLEGRLPPQPKKKRLRRLTLRTALAMARRAGQAVCGATVKPDGSVELTFGERQQAPDAEAINPWDQVLDHAAN
jgi:hypothetical protein